MREVLPLAARPLFVANRVYNFAAAILPLLRSRGRCRKELLQHRPLCIRQVRRVRCPGHVLSTLSGCFPSGKPLRSNNAALFGQQQAPVQRSESSQLQPERGESEREVTVNGRRTIEFNIVGHRPGTAEPSSRSPNEHVWITQHLAILVARPDDSFRSLIAFTRAQDRQRRGGRDFSPTAVVLDIVRMMSTGALRDFVTAAVETNPDGTSNRGVPANVRGLLGAMAIASTTRAVVGGATGAAQGGMAQLREFLADETGTVVLGFRGQTVQGQWVNYASDYVDRSQIGRSAAAPLFYSIPNANGGRVWVATTTINQLDFVGLLRTTRANQRVTILTGTHGDRVGQLYRDVQFFHDDLRFYVPNRVQVYDMFAVSRIQLQRAVNSSGRVICAWCFSERSVDTLRVLRAP